MARKPFHLLGRSQQRRILGEDFEEDLRIINQEEEEEQVMELGDNSINEEQNRNILHEKDTENAQIIHMDDDALDVESTLNALFNSFFLGEDSSEDLGLEDDDTEEYWLSESDSEADNDSESDHNFEEKIPEPCNEFYTEKCKVSENCPLKSKLQAATFVGELTCGDTHEFMTIMREIGHEELPVDRRTLLGTLRVTNIIPCESGEYFHYGIKEGLIYVLKRYKLKKELYIDIGIDGLPLSSSSNQKLWPILGKIKGADEIPPFLIGSYYGYKEPEKASPFLDEFINEYIGIKENNFSYEGVTYNVKINNIICDIPARCKCTCSKYYTGFFGCRHCKIEGLRYMKKTIFLDQNCELRTNENFRNREQKEHHDGTSPFEKTEVDMVRSFPIDYMHCVCLGVMRRLLTIWFRGDPKKKIKPYIRSLKIMEEVSNLFLSFGKFMPKEFNRKPQPLTEIGRWKATVLRFFLLYAGPVIMKKYLPEREYKHFNSLSCAIRILCDPVLCKEKNKFANELLRDFVSEFADIYGHEYCTINVHSLIHLAKEVINNDGPLDSFSAFPFENYMQFLKNILRKRNQPLQQLHRRLKEGRRPKKQPTVKTATLKNPLKTPLPLKCQQAHRRLVLPTVEFSIDFPNNCCILRNNVYVIISGICKLDGNIVIIGRRFQSAINLDHYPMASTLLNTCIVQNLSEKQEVFDINEIKSKACIFVHEDVFYVTKLLHF